MIGSRKDLIESLSRKGFLSPDALRLLKARLSRAGIPPVEAALSSGLLPPEARGWLLAERLGLPYVEIDPAAVPLPLAGTVPEGFARKNRAVPVARDGARLTLAVADPFLGEGVDRLERDSGCEVRLVVTSQRSVAGILGRLYPGEAGPPPDEIEGGTVSRERAEGWLAEGGLRGLGEGILTLAAREGFSDVRVRPAADRVRLEGTSGGEAVPLLSLPGKRRKELLDALCRIAGILPETLSGGSAEATFQREFPEGPCSFRATFLKGIAGTEAVIRCLPVLRSPLTLDAVGFDPEQIEIARRMLARRTGLYLLSSPGGEGLSTTLFAMLREVVPPGGRAACVEGTFRFRTEGYVQLEREDALRLYGGMWGRMAESLEPDALLFDGAEGGRDLLELVQVARRGLPVLCGVRSPGLSALLRELLSLAIDPYLLVRVVRMAMFQRLVDLLCTACRRPVPAKPSLQRVGQRYRDDLRGIVEGASFYQPAGCPKCRGKGFSGKIAVLDVLPFTPGVRHRLLEAAEGDGEIERVVAENALPAFRSAADLLGRGMVTFDDVLPFIR